MFKTKSVPREIKEIAFHVMLLVVRLVCNMETMFSCVDSVLGSLFYTYITFVQKSPAKETPPPVVVEVGVKARAGTAGV